MFFHLQEEATMASFRLEDLKKDLAKIEEQREVDGHSHLAASTNLAGSQPLESNIELSSTIHSATDASISDFYSDRSDVGQLWESNSYVLPIDTWGEYDMPTSAWGAERSSSKPSQTDVINNVKKEGKCSFKALARWFTQQFTTNSGVIDSGATGHFLQEGLGIPTGHPSSKVVGMPNGQTEEATKQVLLPLQGLSKQARLGDELPSLRHNSLLSVPKFADHGYTTILSQETKASKCTTRMTSPLSLTVSQSSEGGVTKMDYGVPLWVPSQQV